MRDEKELYESEAMLKRKDGREAKMPEARRSGHPAHYADAQRPQRPIGFYNSPPSSPPFPSNSYTSIVMSD